MYRPDYFGPPDLAAQHDLVEEHPFGLMTLAVDGRPTGVHLPFVLDRDSFPYGRLRGHLSRGNPIARLLHANVEVLVAFTGPSSYLSPDDYATEPHFPTWAYAAVHVTGRPRVLDDARCVRQLTDLIADQEGKLAPKRPWLLPRKSSALFDEYLKLIMAFEVPIARIEGIFKLGQNKSPADMVAQAAAFRARGTDRALELADYIERFNGLERSGHEQPPRAVESA
ncbi:FMN-binding negative transcriptional regulator [Saccharothrix syringae]|uniref:FMN-binding negative transcriptional regulator n=1 Tax=Saccharothrix syringae TaxID=103733 RepID=A0A1X9WEM4_SACSY|nr:FMN-binding negative transcriptional regulator [Saccharothrix syringae]ARS01464.1 NcmM [Saccharothrix syringae]QFZ19268.1 FMN-binding negative transcriptional regulator [Saccharothrix syringae]